MARLPRYALAAAAALVVVLCAALPAAVAAPSTGPVRSATLVAPRWVYLDRDLDVGLRVVTRKSERRVTAELDLIDGAGVSIWHAFQSRDDLGSVTYEYSFSRALRELGVAPGIFTLRARVTSAGSATVERTARLIVMDRAMRPVPVCVVVRVACTPSVEETEAARVTASDAADLGRLAVLHPEFRITAAVPPFLLARWSGAAASADGTSVPPIGSDAVDSLRRAVESGMPLLRGLYADPDLSGIATATADLKRQAARGDAAVAAAFASEAPVPSATATGFAAVSGPLPESAAAILAARGAGFAVTDTSCVLPAHGAVASGAYKVALPSSRDTAGATLIVLTSDRTASARLAAPSGATRLAADLFARAAAEQREQPIVLVVAVGADGIRTSQLAESLDDLAGMPWVRLVSAPVAAAGHGLPAATLRQRTVDRTPAPDGYWAQIAAARGPVGGLLAAAGSTDPDAKAALEAFLMAESRAWAGADGTWPHADRGLALAKKALDDARAVLAMVTLDAPSVTLPGSEGKAPVSITNASGRTLTVRLEASSPDVRVRQAQTTVRLRPGENILSVPVVLGTAPSGRLRVAVTAGGYRIAAATATVRASYQDRVVLLVTVLLILAGLLFYIRRHIATLRARNGSLELEDDEDEDEI